MIRWLAVFLLAGSAWAAPDMNCTLSESLKDLTEEREIHVPMSQRISGTAPFTTPLSRVPGSVRLTPVNGADEGSISLVDPESKHITRVAFPAAPGKFSRLLWMGTDGNVQIDCVRSEESPAVPPPSRLACEVQSLGQTTKFDADLSVSGHDVRPFPGEVDGWVLGYNGIIVIFFRNKETFAGITAMGSWDGEVRASWFPELNKEVRVACRGVPSPP